MSRLRRYSKQLREWLQERHIRVGILVFLIALLSFGAGYLAGRDFSPAPIVIEKAAGGN